MKTRITGSALLTVVITSLAACTSPGSGSESRSQPSGEGNASSPAPRAVPGALDAAHTAYLEGDFIAVAERIRDVLLDPGSSDLVKENAYALLDKSYEVNKGHLPVRFTLPEGYVHLDYGAIRGATRHGPFYEIFVRGRARDASHLKGVTLKRLPDEVLLDKRSGKGKFDLRDDEPGYKDFVLEVKEVPALPADGVFTIRLELDDGTVSESWFIAHGLASSASPEVKSPAPSAALSDPNPVVSWVPFRSPEYVPFEERILNIWAGRDGDEANAWNFWTADPGDLATLKLGNHPGTPSVKLPTGDYWLSVGVFERRAFGPIHLNRASTTALPFHLVR